MEDEGNASGDDTGIIEIASDVVDHSPPPDGSKDGQTGKETGGEMGADAASDKEDSDPGEKSLKAGGTLRKSIFKSRLGSKSSILEDGVKTKERSQSIQEKAVDWRNKFKRKNMPSMPSEQEVLSQFESMIVLKGLEEQRPQLEALPLEGKWDMIVDNMAAENKDSGKAKMKGSRREAGNMVKKLEAKLAPSVTEAFRNHVGPDMSVNRFLDQNGVPVLFGAIASLGQKAEKVSADHQMLLDLVASVKSLQQHPEIAKSMAEQGGPLIVVGCFDPVWEMGIRVTAISVLQGFAAGGNVSAVVAAWDVFCKSRKEHTRFLNLMEMMEVEEDEELRMNLVDFVMLLISGTEDRTSRVQIRQDFLQLGFKTLLSDRAEDEALPEEVRERYTERFDEFKRMQASDNKGGAMDLASSSDFIGPSEVGEPLAGGVGVTSVSSGTERSVHEELSVGELLERARSGMDGSEAMGKQFDMVMRLILGKLGTGEDAMWQWKCLQRLTTMLAGLPHQLNSDFDAAASDPYSPESQLSNLLLGGVAQDAILELRNEVFILREEVKDISRAANVTISDLQAELEQAKKSKTRKKRTTHLGARSGSTVDSASLLDLAAVSPSTSGASTPASASPRAEVKSRRTVKKKKSTASHNKDSLDKREAAAAAAANGGGEEGSKSEKKGEGLDGVDGTVSSPQSIPKVIVTSASGSGSLPRAQKGGRKPKVDSSSPSHALEAAPGSPAPPTRAVSPPGDREASDPSDSE